MVQLQLTDEQQRALDDAAALLDAQAEGLRRIGSANTVAALKTYADTLRTLSQAGGAPAVTAEQRTHVEQAQHILEGIRDGLLNADFEKRGHSLENTVRALDEIVTQFNTLASQP